MNNNRVFVALLLFCTGTSLLGWFGVFWELRGRVTTCETVFHKLDDGYTGIRASFMLETREHFAEVKVWVKGKITRVELISDFGRTSENPPKVEPSRYNGDPSLLLFSDLQPGQRYLVFLYVATLDRDVRVHYRAQILH